MDKTSILLEMYHNRFITEYGMFYKIVDFFFYFKIKTISFLNCFERLSSFPLIKHLINFKLVETIVLPDCFLDPKWETFPIRQPYFIKSKIRELTPEDLFLKNFKYEPVDLAKFKITKTHVNDMYYDNFPSTLNPSDYFQTKGWININTKYFMNMKEIINTNNSKAWVEFYPRTVTVTDRKMPSVSFIDVDYPNRYYSIKFYLFDMANNNSYFKYKDQFSNVISFKNTFTNSDNSKTSCGFYISLKTNSDVFKLLTSAFITQVFDNYIMSKLFTSFYLNIAKDLSISSISDFKFVYKTIGSWTSYSELNFGANGNWVFNSKIVDEKVVYDWKWKRNTNTFVPHGKFNMNHYVRGTPPSRFEFSIPWDSVSIKLDRIILNELLLYKKLINQELPRVESEAWRITWENFRRYRTCRMWRYFPHHAEYVEKFFTDPRKRKK